MLGRGGILAGHRAHYRHRQVDRAEPGERPVDARERGA
jgi:hypothetical protein